MAKPIECSFDRHLVATACRRAAFKAGSRIEISSALIPHMFSKRIDIAQADVTAV
jgi:hypothetical protein